MSSVTCCVTAIDPPLSKSPTMQGRLVCNYPKTKTNFKTTKIFQLAYIRDTLFDQKSTVHQKVGFPGGDVKHTTHEKQTL